MFLACAMCANDRARAQERTPDDESIRALLTAIEQSVRASNGPAFVALHTANADRNRTLDFMSSELMPNATRAVVQERDRQALPGSLPGNGYRLMVDTFTEYTAHARAATWRLDIKRVAEAGAPREWAIAEEERISSVENLYRLGLN